MDFQKSETFQNVQDAYQEKLKAASLYAMASVTARDEDFKQIFYTLSRISWQELQHAKVWQRMLQEAVPTTYLNLKNAYEWEEKSWKETYKGYAKTAKDEGFMEVAGMFEKIATADRQHEFLLRRMYDNMALDETFCRPTAQIWICTRCGYVHWGDCAPQICPICNGPQGNYELNCENY